MSGHSARLLGAILLLGAAGGADAQILKCKDANGHVTYTQASCPSGTAPVELPEGVSSDTGSSLSLGGGSDRALSPRARELDQLFDACMQPSSEDCARFQAIGRHCSNRYNWDQPDCAAMREVNSAFTSRLDRASQSFRERDREKCADGDREACDDLKCPLSLMMEGTDDEVRACSRHRALPSNERWAQIKQRTDEEGMWSGDYICLQFVRTQNLLGQNIAVRPSIAVREVRNAGGAKAYRVSGARRQTFATLDEAIAAGCEGMGAKWKKLPEALAGG